MKQIIFALAMVLAVEQLPGQVVSKNSKISSAPLFLYSSDGGTISPLKGGQQLTVGNKYSMTAVPNAGYKFDKWQRVEVSIDVDRVQYPSGAVTGSSNATVKALSESVTTPSVGFVMPPVLATTNNYGFHTRTAGEGWKANFTRVNSVK